MTTFKKSLLSLAMLAALVLCAIGCSTTATTNAFKVEAGAQISVSAAMGAWNVYVATKHPGTNAEETVRIAFEAWKTAELGAVAATESLALAPTNTPATVDAANAATAALASSAQGLVTIIQSFGVTFTTNAAAK